MAFHSRSVNCASGTHRITHPDTTPVPFFRAVIYADNSNVGYVTISPQDNQGTGRELRSTAGLNSVELSSGDLAAVYYTATNVGDLLEVLYWD